MTTEERINNMIKWCDKVAVKWKNNGMKKVTPVYKYNNKDCTAKGGYCRFCKPSRKKAYFCNSYVVAAVVHGLGFTKHGFMQDCIKWRGKACSGQMSRDFDPSVKAGTGWTVVSGISKSKPIYCNTDAQIKEANKKLKKGDVLMIGKPGICHTAIWYGNGLITEAAGDAGCCTRSAKYIDRGQKRRIVKVYRFTGPKAASTTSKPKTTSTAKSTKKGYIGSWPTLPKKGYLSKGNKGEQVKKLQKFLNWYGNYKLAVDGVFGSITDGAVRKFQKAEKITVDGKFGKQSLAKAKTVKK